MSGNKLYYDTDSGDISLNIQCNSGSQYLIKLSDHSTKTDVYRIKENGQNYYYKIKIVKVS